MEYEYWRSTGHLTDGGGVIGNMGVSKTSAPGLSPGRRADHERDAEGTTVL